MRQSMPFHLPALEPEEAIQAWEEVEYVKAMPGWERIQDALQTRVDGLQSALVSGAKETPADYERIIGEMRGITAISQVIDGIKKRAEEAA